jgi:hypothetical protein
MHADESPYKKIKMSVKSDYVKFDFNMIIDENVLKKMIDFGILEVIIFDKNGEPELTNLNRKFYKYMTSYGKEWIDQQGKEILRLCNNDPITTDLGLSLIMLSNYLGLTQQEMSDRMEELLPVAHGVIQVFEGLHFQVNNK